MNPSVTATQPSGNSRRASSQVATNTALRTSKSTGPAAGPRASSTGVVMSALAGMSPLSSQLIACTRSCRMTRRMGAIVESVADTIHQGASDSALELGGISLHSRREISGMALENRVETEQHDCREGIEEL